MKNYNRKTIKSIVVLLLQIKFVACFQNAPSSILLHRRASLSRFQNTLRSNNKDLLCMRNIESETSSLLRSHSERRSYKDEKRPPLHKFYRFVQNSKKSMLISKSKEFDELESENFSSKPRNRPIWASKWMPSWLITMHPLVQLSIGTVIYLFHLTVLTQRQIAFPFQLIPNNRGRFQSIGFDSLAGMISMIVFFLLRKGSKENLNPSVPKVLSEPKFEELPWKKLYDFKNPANIPLSPSIRALTYLLIAYASTGRFTMWFESLLYTLVGMGVPMTIAMHRSLVVLLGHFAWVGVGCLILELELKPFFNRTKTKWYKLKWDTYWLWWTLGGYFVSAWVFNIADFVNQIVLPSSVFEQAGEGVVSQLINPENNDFAASLVGYIAPCLSAPWWEEILYRGFILPALCLQMKFWPASILSALIFSAHHMSTTGFIPLAALGMTWATLYAKCGNLLVTILIHAMWNSRVFLGSWFGL